MFVLILLRLISISASAGPICDQVRRELISPPEVVEKLGLSPVDSDFAAKVLSHYWEHALYGNTVQSLHWLKQKLENYRYWKEKDPSFLLKEYGCKNVFDFSEMSLQEVVALLLLKKDVSDRDLRAVAPAVKHIRSFLRVQLARMVQQGASAWKVESTATHNQADLDKLDQLISRLRPDQREALSRYEQAAPSLESEAEFEALIASIESGISPPTVSKPILREPLCVGHWCLGGIERSLEASGEFRGAVQRGAIGGANGQPAPIDTFAAGVAGVGIPDFKAADFTLYYLNDFDRVAAEKERRGPPGYLLNPYEFSRRQPEFYPTLLPYHGHHEQLLELLLLEGIKRGTVELPGP